MANENKPKINPFNSFFSSILFLFVITVIIIILSNSLVVKEEHITTQAMASQNCQPFYRRMFYHHNEDSEIVDGLSNPTSPSSNSNYPSKTTITDNTTTTMSIYFNTNSSCQASYVLIQWPNQYKVVKVPCKQTKIAIDVKEKQEGPIVNDNDDQNHQKHLKSQGQFHPDFSKVGFQVTKFDLYVQKCQFSFGLNEKEKDSYFRYTAYGKQMRPMVQPGLSKRTTEFIQRQTTQVFTLSQSQSLQLPSSTIEVDLMTDSFPVQAVVTADWGVINKRPYTSIYQSLRSMIRKRIDEREMEKQREKQGKQHIKQESGPSSPRITNLIINGDIAYDLDSNNGSTFHTFMAELQQVSAHLPILINTGNHQSIRQVTREILYQAFYIGKIVKVKQKDTKSSSTQQHSYSLSVQSDRVDWYNLNNKLNYVVFDPFLQIYNISTPEQTQRMLTKIKEIVLMLKQQYPNAFTIVSSHYPLSCSQLDDTHCTGIFDSAVLKQLVGWLSQDKRVDLYIGAHMHQYERLVPYVDRKWLVSGERLNKIDLRDIKDKSLSNKKESEDKTTIISQLHNHQQYERGKMPSVVQAVAGNDIGVIDFQFEQQNNSVAVSINLTGFGILTVEKRASQKFQAIDNVGEQSTQNLFDLELTYQHLAVKDKGKQRQMFVQENRSQQNLKQQQPIYDIIDEFAIKGKTIK